MILQGLMLIGMVLETVVVGLVVLVIAVGALLVVVGVAAAWVFHRSTHSHVVRWSQMQQYLFDASRAISFIVRNDLFDGRIYNVLTVNAVVRQIVDTIRAFAPDLEVSFVDNKIMNQLSYEVSCEQFVGQGFTFAGDLQRGIGETVALLRNANGGKFQGA